MMDDTFQSVRVRFVQAKKRNRLILICLTAILISLMWCGAFVLAVATAAQLYENELILRYRLVPVPTPAQRPRDA